MLLRTATLVGLLSGCTVIAPLVAGGGAAIYNASTSASEVPDPQATRIAFAKSIVAARQRDCDTAAAQAGIVATHDSVTTERLLTDPRLEPCIAESRNAVADARSPVSVGLYTAVGVLVGISMDAFAYWMITQSMRPWG